jgi:hypothetical protein
VVAWIEIQSGLLVLSMVSVEKEKPDRKRVEEHQGSMKDRNSRESESHPGSFRDFIIPYVPGWSLSPLYSLFVYFLARYLFMRPHLPHSRR